MVHCGQAGTDDIGKYLKVNQQPPL